MEYVPCVEAAQLACGAVGARTEPDGWWFVYARCAWTSTAGIAYGPIACMHASSGKKPASAVYAPLSMIRRPRLAVIVPSFYAFYLVGLGKLVGEQSAPAALLLIGAVLATVGAALGQNPVLVVVPCHRFLAADGKLTGFAAGLTWKRALLELEGSLLPMG